jgi:hypothetical protein
MEALVHFVLPLFCEITRTDYKTALNIAPGNQFLYKKPRHDGLPGTRVIRKKEPQGLTGKHTFVYGSNLMRKRFYQRRMDCQYRIEKVGKSYPLRLRDQAEQAPIPIEAPGPADLYDLDLRFIGSVEKLIGYPS